MKMSEISEIVDENINRIDLVDVISSNNLGAKEEE